MTQLADSVVLITGANGGLGTEFVRQALARGAHLAYADTPMTARRTDVDKADPRDIVAAIYDGLEAGEAEVLADDTSRQIKQNLSQPLTALYPELAS
jgi:NAD(P)-dependent dehydrogenase (short-subunit alcohol dehydrogenase family)